MKLNLYLFSAKFSIYQKPPSLYFTRCIPKLGVLYSQSPSKYAGHFGCSIPWVLLLKFVYKSNMLLGMPDFRKRLWNQSFSASKNNHRLFWLMALSPNAGVTTCGVLLLCIFRKGLRCPILRQLRVFSANMEAQQAVGYLLGAGLSLQPQTSDHWLHPWIEPKPKERPYKEDQKRQW